MKYTYRAKRKGFIKRSLTNLTAVAIILANSVGASLPFVLSTNSVSAATDYTSVPLTQTEINTNWIVDRATPSGGYESLTYEGRADSIEMRIDNTNANADPWRWHEGLKRSLPSGSTAVKADLYLDSDWQTKNTTAGIWGVGTDSSSAISAYPIVQFTTSGESSHVGWRTFNDSAGGYTNLATSFTWDTWNTVELVLNPSTTLFDIYINGINVSQNVASGSESLDAVILNNYNYSTNDNNDDYMVHWSNFAIGDFVPDATLNNENFNTVDANYKGISVGFNAVNFGTVTEVTVDLERADGSHVIKTGNQGVFDIINGATTPQQLTTPFVIEEGTFTEAGDTTYWDPAPAVWSNATTPASVTITVTDENGTVTVTNNLFNEGSPSWPTYLSLLPKPVKNVEDDILFDTIQEAIDAPTTDPSETIEVSNGTFDPFVVNSDDNVTIRAAAGSNPLIQGTTPSNNRIVDIRSNGITLDGFTIRPLVNGEKVGVSMSGNGLTIRNNTVENTLTAIQTTTAIGGGNSNISNNVITNSGVGISLQNSGNTVKNNNVSGTTLESVASNQAGNTIEFNNFLSDAGVQAASYGISFDVTKNWWGSQSGIGTINGSVDSDPWLCQPYQDGSNLSINGVCPVDPNGDNRFNISGSVYRDIALDNCDTLDECKNQRTNDMLEGWTMNLYKEDSSSVWQLVQSRTTNSNGVFAFSAQQDAGVYHVCEVLEAGWTQPIQTWSGSGYKVDTPNLSGNTEEGPYCNTLSYADTADRSHKSNFGNVDTTKPTTTVVNPSASGQTYNSDFDIDVQSTDGQSGIVKAVVNLYSGTGTLLSTCVNETINPAVSSHDFTCSIDVSALGDGEYYIKTNARDAGNNLSNTVTWAFNIDATSPDVSGIVLNSQTVNNNDVRSENCDPIVNFYNVNGEIDLSATITDAFGDVSNARYKVRKVNASGCTVSSIFSSGNVNMTNTSGDTWEDGTGFDTNTVPEDGKYTILLQTTDNNGNTTTKYIDILIDNTAPNISWQKQPNTHYSYGEGFHVRPITSEVGTVKTVYIDTVATENLCYEKDSDHKNMDTKNTNCQTLWDGLSDGTHKFIAVFTDYTGNSTTSESNSFIVDRSAPQISVKDGYVGNLGSKVFSNVSFKLYDMYMVDKYTINGVERDFTNNKWSDANFQNIEANLVEGFNTLVLYDVAGNSTTYEFTYDSTAPAVPEFTLNASNGDVIINGGTTNSYTVVANWTSVPDATGYQYRYSNSISGDTYETPNYYNVQTAATTLTGVFNRGEGMHHLQVRAYDEAGNFSDWSDVFDVIYDTTAPTTLTIETIPTNSSTTRTISGFTEPGALVEVEVNSVPQFGSTYADINGAWSLAFSGLAVGNHNVFAIATDSAGNSTTENSSFEVTPPPAVESANTNTPSNPNNGSSSNAPNGSITGTNGNLAFSAASTNGQVLAQETGENDSLPEGADVDAEVQADLDEARATATGENDENTNDCSKILGICWYWWIPIGLSIIAILYVIFRPKDIGEI